MLQGCFSGVARKFKGCFKDVSRVFQGSLKCVSRKHIKSLSKKFCFVVVVAASRAEGGLVDKYE